MAPSDRNAQRRGSHFSTGGAPRAQAPGRAAATRPPSHGRPRAVAARPVRTISRRTAAATRRVSRHDVRRSDPRRRSRVPLLAVALALVVVVGLVALVVVPSLTRQGDSSPARQVADGEQVSVTIPEGSSAGQVAQALYDCGVISSTSDFLSAARRTQADSSFKSGSYLFTAGSDVQSIIDLLQSGPNATEGALTVPEGYTLAQIASAVEAAYGIPASDFTAQAKASNYVGDYPFLASAGDDSLEGYLFPKTYTFSSDTPSADEVIRAMLSQYQTEVSGIDFDAAASAIRERYGVTVSEHDILTMASIIEREAVTDEQRPKVASVFYNRMEQGMSLQSDATLAYSLGRQVTADDLKVDDPYNTYTRDGLTPTPICSPGLASIQAAAYPDDTDYLYFFLDGDYEAFSVTNDEHNSAIANRPQ